MNEPVCSLSINEDDDEDDDSDCDESAVDGKTFR